MAAGTWQFIEISCRPAVLLMFKRAFRPFVTHRSYRVRKSALAAAEVTAIIAGGGGLDDVPFRTMSAQEVSRRQGCTAVPAAVAYVKTQPAHRL
jgi:hypothetical protein